MIKTLTAATIIAAASLSFASIAQAEDFPATPMNHGPMMMHGMGPMGDIMNMGMMPMNMVAQPVAAMGTPASEPMAAPMMMKKHHHKHMMKPKM